MYEAMVGIVLTERTQFRFNRKNKRRSLKMLNTLQIFECLLFYSISQLSLILILTHQIILIFYCVLCELKYISFNLRST